LENIVGIIFFILFIVVRAMADRKKGMAGKPGGKKKQPAAVPGRTGTRQAGPAKTGTGYAQLEREPLRKRAEPVSAKTKVVARPVPVLAEGESYYDSQSQPEGIKPEADKGLTGGAQQDLSLSVQEYVLTNEDLRKAVIWSEILQKPRFRARPRYLR